MIRGSRLDHEPPPRHDLNMKPKLLSTLHSSTSQDPIIVLPEFLITNSIPLLSSNDMPGRRSRSPSPDRHHRRSKRRDDYNDDDDHKAKETKTIDSLESVGAKEISDEDYLYVLAT